MNTRLKEIRENRELLQKDIAQVLNTSQQQYSRYETEENEISVTLLKQLAKFYNTSIDYLVNFTDDQRPYPRKNNH